MKRLRHELRRYNRTRGLKWVDRAGARVGRLTYREWVGYWGSNPWWKAACDCGTEQIRIYSPTIRSCGCLQRESRRKRDFRVLRVDGTWQIPRARPVILSDGQRFSSISALARHVGISKRAMIHRLKTMPESEWLKPGRPTGVGAARHRRRLNKEWHATREKPRRQPWSAANLAAHNATRSR